MAEFGHMLLVQHESGFKSIRPDCDLALWSPTNLMNVRRARYILPAVYILPAPMIRAEHNERRSLIRLTCRGLLIGLLSGESS